MSEKYDKDSLDATLATILANQKSMKQQMTDHNTALMFKLDVADMRFVAHEKIDEERHKQNVVDIKDVGEEVKKLNNFKIKAVGIFSGIVIALKGLEHLIFPSHKP
jgi:hypothetical protein